MRPRAPSAYSSPRGAAAGRRSSGSTTALPLLPVPPFLSPTAGRQSRGAGVRCEAGEPSQGADLELPVTAATTFLEHEGRVEASGAVLEARAARRCLIRRSVAAAMAPPPHCRRRRTEAE
jgi:hypothetical protein